MKNILFLLIVAFIGYSVITTPEVSEKIQIHLAAIQRHALEIAKEKASQVIAEHGDEIVSALTTQLQGAAPSSQNAQPGLT